MSQARGVRYVVCGVCGVASYEERRRVVPGSQGIGVLGKIRVSRSRPSRRMRHRARLPRIPAGLVSSGYLG